MISDPQNILEQVQNEIAAEIAALALFTGITMPDGSAFQILTEDEGDPEFLFTEMIAKCGLSVVVQSPTGKFSSPDEVTLRANPFVLAISISEAVAFNRGEQGTGVRISRALMDVLKAVNNFAPPSLGAKLSATMLLKDKDTQPGTDALVASRILIFEAADVIIPLT